MTVVSGVVPVDKPAGPTSHDVVAGARRALGTRRIGHSGTLDPFATGLLLICVGSATRLSEYLTGLPKSYIARMRLGVSTDTDDLQGEVVSTSADWTHLNVDVLTAAFAGFQGTIMQVPPRYSAKKIDGERAYAVARRGEALDQAPTPITVHRIRVAEISLPDVAFEVDCSSGTYIRAIARDIGEVLSVGGHLTALRRTRIGDFSVEAAVPYDRLSDAELVEDRIMSPLQAVGHLSRFEVSDADSVELKHGRPVPIPDAVVGEGPIAAASNDGTLAAIGYRDGDLFRPRKVFA